MRGTFLRLFLSAVVAAMGLGVGRASGSAGAAAASAAAGAAGAAPGYWLTGSDGGIFTYGSARFAGSTGGLHLVAPVVAMANSPTGQGYWLAAADGGVFAFGDAAFAGSAGGLRLAAPVVAMAATPTGRGCWLAAADGGVFAFGDATFWGSAIDPSLKGPVVAMAAAPSGLGYRLVTASGQVIAFGDARWLGDASKVHLAAAIVSAMPTPSGRGYWLIARDGGVLTYGDAPFLGSTGRLALVRPIVGVAATATGFGYWLVASDGGVFAFGDAPFLGSAGRLQLAAPVVGLVRTPLRHGVGVATFFYPWYASQGQDGMWRHWDEGGHVPPDDVGSDYYPERGAYSSDDPVVLDGEMHDIALAGVDEIVTSWWGQGSFEDHALPLVLAAAAAHGVRVAVHLEPYPGRSPATIAADLAYLDKLGIHEVWIYEAMQLSGDDLRPVLDSFPGDLFLAETGSVENVQSGYFAQWAAATHFAAVYTYEAVRYEGRDLVAFCAYARRVGVGCVTGVSPGFSSIRGEGDPGYARSRDNGSTYDNRWMGAIGARADAVAITSFNEWNEGTQIEAAIPKCLSATFCYQNYDGAYGLFGPPAVAAYLGRTRVWTDRYRASSP